MTTYTVVGGRGFIGAALVRRLRAAGAVVTVVGREDPVGETDLGTVLYCAGMTADYAQRPFATVEAQVGRLSEILEHGRFEHLVYLSSVRLYDGLGSAAVSEESTLSLTPSNPRHLFDLSKALGENLCLTAAEGRATAIRVGAVFDTAAGSPGFLSELLIEAGRQRHLVRASSPAAARDYIHLTDLVDGVLAVAEHRPGGIINVTSGANLTNADLADCLRAQGWHLELTGPDLAEASAPRIDITRLRALGVAPRAVSDVIADHCAALTALTSLEA